MWVCLVNYMYTIVCPYVGLWDTGAGTPGHEFLGVCIVPTCGHVVARWLGELRGNMT